MIKNTRSKILFLTGTETQSLNNLIHGFDDRFQKVIEEIRANLSTGELIIDIGCGEGKIWQLFHDCNVVGLDVSVKNLKKAKKYLRSIRGSGEYIPIKSGSVDLVIASEILEHVFYPEREL